MPFGSHSSEKILKRPGKIIAGRVCPENCFEDNRDFIGTALLEPLQFRDEVIRVVVKVDVGATSRSHDSSCSPIESRCETNLLRSARKFTGDSCSSLHHSRHRSQNFRIRSISGADNDFTLALCPIEDPRPVLRRSLESQRGFKNFTFWRSLQHTEALAACRTSTQSKI